MIRIFLLHTQFLDKVSSSASEAILAPELPESEQPALHTSAAHNTPAQKNSFVMITLQKQIFAARTQSDIKTIKHRAEFIFSKVFKSSIFQNYCSRFNGNYYGRSQKLKSTCQVNCKSQYKTMKKKKNKQRGLFDEAFRREKLEHQGDPLIRLNNMIQWEIFRPIVEQVHESNPKGPGGRPPYDSILKFKMLILQRLYNISDEQLEFPLANPYTQLPHSKKKDHMLRD